MLFERTPKNVLPLLSLWNYYYYFFSENLSYGPSPQPLIRVGIWTVMTQLTFLTS